MPSATVTVTIGEWTRESTADPDGRASFTDVPPGAGKVKVTGLGLPSELAGYVQKGVVPKFAIWNPIDLGYSSLQVATYLARGGKLEQPIAAGRMGSITFGADGVGAMSKPFIYDASNVAEFAKIF